MTCIDLVHIALTTPTPLLIHSNTAYSIRDIVAHALQSSKSHASRLIEQNAVKIDSHPVTNHTIAFIDDDIPPVLSIGKRTHMRLTTLPPLKMSESTEKTPQ